MCVFCIWVCCAYVQTRTSRVHQFWVEPGFDMVCYGATLTCTGRHKESAMRKTETFVS